MIEPIEYEEVYRYEDSIDEIGAVAYDLTMRLIQIQGYVAQMSRAGLTPSAAFIDSIVRNGLKFKPAKQYPLDREQMTGPEIAAAAVADLDSGHE